MYHTFDRNGSGACADSRLACPAAHTSPRDAAVLSAPESARAIEITPIGVERKLCPIPKSPRGCVVSFSRASRRRLLWLIAQVSESHLASSLFLTLTYPASDRTSARPKRDLDVFMKRIARRFPQTFAIWKMEYTKRDVPHFHILLFGVDYWNHRDLAHTWADVVRSSHPDHERAGTQVTRVESAAHAGRYVSKYVGKVGSLPPWHIGRCWGRAGQIASFLSPKRYFRLTIEQLHAARRMLDQLRLSLKRSAKFRRRAQTNIAQRWFLTGPEVIRYLTWLGCPSTLAPG